MTRAIVAFLAAALVFEAGAVSPGVALADEPSPTPVVDPSPTTQPSEPPSPHSENPPTDATPPGTERADLRTEASRTYEQADGSFVTELYSGAVHYQPEGRTDWQPIDLTLAATAVDGAAAAVIESPVVVCRRLLENQNSPLP